MTKRFRTRGIHRTAQPRATNITEKLLNFSLVWLPTLLVVLFILNGCDFQKPVLIGFSGQLTGPHADMGVSGRDGAQLAIDRINVAGGIAGRQVKLVVRDDKGTPEGARAADQELIDAGVVAIIGHMTSAQSMAAIPVVEKAGMVLLSPTTSTPVLSGRVDHFFRTSSDSSIQARYLAHHVVHDAGLKHLAAIYDESNASYTKTFLDAFRDEVQKKGGAMVSEVSYTSIDNPSFGPLVAQLRTANPQGFLILSSAYDAALIAQQPRILGWQTDLFVCGWAASDSLLENGGKSVEGMTFVNDYDRNRRSPEFIKFQQQYQAQFKQRANFMATFAYETMLVLASALEKTNGLSEGLIQALPGSQVQGPTGSVSLDQFGDGLRTQYLITIRDGKFVNNGILKQ